MPVLRLRSGNAHEDVVMFGLKARAKPLMEAFWAGLLNTGHVTATVSGKPVMTWHGTMTQKDGVLKKFPIMQQRLMPEASLEAFADGAIASIHDDGGMAKNADAYNTQIVAMLWRLFTTPVDNEGSGLTYGDLISLKNFDIAFDLHEQPNDQFKITWHVQMKPGRWERRP